MSSVVLGAIGPAKANASRRCAVGNFLCIKAVATVGSVLKVDVGVYADDDDARAVGDFLQDPSDASLQAAHDDAIARELHTEVNVSLTILKAMAVDWRWFLDVGGGGGGTLCTT